MSNLITIRKSAVLYDTFGIDEYPELDTVLRFLSLLNVQTYYIAGGYFRDKLLGVTPKDVDVFIPGVQPLDIWFDEKIRYSLEDTLDFEVEGVRINIVKLFNDHTFETVLQRMDIGLCQIGYLNGDIVATPEFVRDRDEKTITVLFPVTTEGDHDHVQRVIAKYPDYEVKFT